MNKILDYFNFPESALVKNRVAIKAIVEQLDVSKSDENLLRSQISALYLVSILDTETTLLKSVEKDDFRYEEIQVFFVELKTMNKNISLHNKLQTLFPNPTIVITNYQEKYKLSTAEKRINQIDTNLAVVDQVYMTNKLDIRSERSKDFLSALDYNRHQFKDLFELYETYQNAIYSQKLVDLVGFYPSKLLDAKFIKDVLNQIASIDTDINRINESYKDATSMNEKITIHKKIKKHEEKKNKLIDRIKEELNDG
jgi:hypothetical protein